MSLKLTLLGFLLLSGLWCHVLAVAMRLLRHRSLGWMAFGIGWVLAVAAVAVRAVQLRAWPLGSMLDVFCVLAALMLPICLFSLRFLRVGYPAVEAVLAVAVLFPAAFVARFSEMPQPVPPILQSPLMIPHVLAYLLGYAILAKSAVLGYLVVRGTYQPDEADLVENPTAVRRLVRLGLPFMTAGLLLGAVWGKKAWGDWWNWDPKELWSLATWLIFVIALHLPAVAPRKPRLHAVFVLAGGVCIVLTLVWVNLSNLFTGLHNYAG